MRGLLPTCVLNIGPRRRRINQEAMMTLSNLSRTALVALGFALFATPSAATAQSRDLESKVRGPGHQVIVGGTVIGQDPDPNVRLEIWRDKNSNGRG
jgi:hypothetical protein